MSSRFHDVAGILSLMKSHCRKALKTKYLQNLLVAALVGTLVFPAIALAVVGVAASQEDGDSSPPAKADLYGSLDWRGWQGLQYKGSVRHPYDWKWTDDEQDPSFPSLFLDRLTINGKFGARVDLDAAAYAPADGIGPVADRLQVRRWRVYTTGDAIVVVPFSYTH